MKKFSLEKDLEKEWIITNGIGGYASSTSIGVNTRKYHGLLVAPLNAPGNRYLTLSKLDESIEIDGQYYGLYTNICKNHISGGYKHLTDFTKEYVPTFTYKVKDIEITKQVCLEYGKNTVYVLYTVKNKGKKAKLTLAPIINYRNFHHLTKEIPNIDHTIYMNTSEGVYIPHHNDIFKGMLYLEEEKRGFDGEENLWVPGRYEIEIGENEEKEISFIFTLEKLPKAIDAKKIIKKEIERLEEVVGQNKDYKSLIIASDNFIAKRGKLHTIIAGYPWFLDWSRDTLIAFNGLVLATGRLDIAKDILKLAVKDINSGLIPNGYDEYTNAPLYNSVDASLLLFEAIEQYLAYTEDYDFIKKDIYKYLKEIIDNYIKGITLDNNNIYLDTDFLIVSGTESTQNTWMDAKVNGTPVTPRNGKAVEINAMWYNALRIMESLSKKFKDNPYKDMCEDIANNVYKTFNEKFYNKKKKCLYDVIGQDEIRPNQLFAISLTYPIIEDDKLAVEMFETVTDKLYTKYGLKTLAKGEKGYVDTYAGDEYARDTSYHNGIIWPWLLGPYYDALSYLISVEKRKTKKAELEKIYKELIEDVKETFGELNVIPELYDATKSGKGTFNQAWSVGEVLRILLCE